MNHIRWAAWGVVDIENMPTDITPGKGNQRQARRNYLRKVHAELKEHGITLHPGGSTKAPFYAVEKGDKKHTAAGSDAFKRICTHVLEMIGDTSHVGGADGSVRGAGDEGQGEPGQCLAQ
jgi:hypothetical protein